MIQLTHIYKSQSHAEIARYYPAEMIAVFQLQLLAQTLRELADREADAVWRLQHGSQD